MELLTVTQVAERLDLSEGRVRVLAHEKRLPYRRTILGEMRFRSEDVERFAQVPRKPGRPRKG